VATNNAADVYNIPWAANGSKQETILNCKRYTWLLKSKIVHNYTTYHI